MYYSHDTEKHLTLSMNKSTDSREICSIRERVKVRTEKLHTFSSAETKTYFQDKKALLVEPHNCRMLF